MRFNQGCWRKYSHRAICHDLVCFFCLFLLCTPASLPAQDDPLVERESDAEKPRKLNRSLALDIQSAKHDELLAWCRVLDLAEEGDEESLRKKLRDYYGIGVETGGTSIGTGTGVVVESAHKGEYFEVEVDNSNVEAVIRLSGGVIITAETTDRRHRVEADQVVFNQDQRTISVMGNVSYIVTIDGEEEKYSGDRIVFKISDWTGIIFRGAVKRTQEVDDKTVDFLFRGESIRQPREGILLFNKGNITSDPNSYYMLKARKIWITGPSEWGLLNATLYVGHIPVFYFPFYWKSGNDLFFNPVIGNQNRVGYYIQTSTYLIGRKKPKDEFAIMGFGSSDDSDYELVREGLFLTRKKGGEESVNRNTLKYMLDVYTSLGAMTGFLGEFTTGESSVNFYTTIAVSRSINSDGNVYFREDEEAKVYWNSSQVDDTRIPFRWGTSLDYKIDDWLFSLNWYSDPFYLQDFDNRKEDFDWLSYLLGEEGADVEEVDLVTDLKWEIAGSERIKPKIETPWFKGFVMDSFRVSLTWRNKENEELRKPNNPDREYNPLRNFYYPHVLILPDLRFSFSGGSPVWSLDRFNRPEVFEDAAEEPITESPRNPETDSTPFRDSLDSIYSSELLSASISYGIQSQLYIEQLSNSSDWSSPSEIDFDFEPAKISTSPRGHLDYRLDFWNGLTGLAGTTSLSGLYQTHMDMFGKKSPVNNETRLVDYQETKLLWDNRTGLYLKPFQRTSTFSDSSFNYDLDATLYTYRFANGATLVDPNYSGYWLSGKDDIHRNSASLSIIWKPGAFSTSFLSTADVPPLNQRYSIGSALGFDYEGWKLDVSQQTLYESSRWDPQPLIMKASWKGWKDEVEISQSARYDIDHNRIADTETIFKFWGFETNFVANYGTNYTWNQKDFIWEEDSKGFAPRHLNFLFHREFKPAPFWKNRIRLHTIIDTSWNINLNQPTDNVLKFIWTQKFHTYKFIDIQLAFTASNKSMYTYFPWWRKRFDIFEKLNFFEDLIKSLNIFRAKDRYESNFNMERLDLTLVHHLGNWDLTVQYGGWPEYDQVRNIYSWKSNFSLFVKWNPLPMFNQKTSHKNDKWSVESFEY